ncbi:MAG: hypothetical protein Q9P01_16140 [Anaerolineae bacterium]|nr:hypothetical protein [Anaerolineae bacterium]
MRRATIAGLTLAVISIIIAFLDLMLGFGFIFPITTPTATIPQTPPPIIITETPPSATPIIFQTPSPTIITDTPQRTPSNSLEDAIETWLLGQGFSVDNTLMNFAQVHADYLGGISSLELNNADNRCTNMQSGQTIDDIGLGYPSELVLIVISSTERTITIDDVQSIISPILPRVSVTNFGYGVNNGTFQNVAIILSVGDRGTDIAPCYSQRKD